MPSHSLSIWWKLISRKNTANCAAWSLKCWQLWPMQLVSKPSSLIPNKPFRWWSNCRMQDLSLWTLKSLIYCQVTSDWSSLWEAILLLIYLTSCLISSICWNKCSYLVKAIKIAHKTSKPMTQRRLLSPSTCYQWWLMKWKPVSALTSKIPSITSSHYATTLQISKFEKAQWLAWADWSSAATIRTLTRPHNLLENSSNCFGILLKAKTSLMSLKTKSLPWKIVSKCLELNSWNKRKLTN